MTLTQLSAALMALILTSQTLAADISIQDAYARASNPQAGAAFLVIHNSGPESDRLIAVTSDAAKRVEIHTHKEIADGVMQMMQLEDGIPIPAGTSHALARGGDHVMFMGLTAPFEPGGVVPVVLTFETAGEIAVEIPVDQDRMPMAQGH
ncbi:MULTISPECIES: copper chaperone PCu(A)C [unclassified Marinovum]